jgi:hypothetical protein
VSSPCRAHPGQEWTHFHFKMGSQRGGSNMEVLANREISNWHILK